MDYARIFEYDFGVRITKRSGINWMGNCPIPTHPDTNASFSFNVETGQCRCFGCGFKGNAVTMARALNHDNPSQYRDNNNNGYIEPIRPPIVQDKTDNNIYLSEEKLNALKVKYHNNLSEDDKTFYEGFGRRDDGVLVWFYEEAIKYHKAHPHWDSVDKESRQCQIYGFEKALDIPENGTLFIFEGEKDVSFSPYKAISFSGGCQSIPKDLSMLKSFKKITIVYDNDEHGEKGSIMVAKALANEFDDVKIKIAQWDKDLPKGFDVYDDFETNGSFDNVQNAIKNAIVFELDKNEMESNDTETKTTQSKGYETMNIFELIEAYKEPPNPIIEHLVYEGGVTLVSGTDGVGKTWFAIQMGLAIAKGESFLDFNVAQKKVLMIQFELSPDELSDRLSNYNLDGLSKTEFDVAILKDEDAIFSESWEKIHKTISDKQMTNGVVIVDNLYTSTNKDVSNNQDLKPLLRKLHSIKTSTGNAFIVTGHHNKHEGDEPILNKQIIQGGKTLTNYVNNVFQIGTSSMGADVRRGKITKTRGSYTDLEHQPLRLEWNPDECLFYRRGIISNERLHTIELEKQWEIKVLVEMSDRLKEDEMFDRQLIMTFVSSEFPDDLPDTSYRKCTRWITKMKSFGLVKGGNNRYYVNHDEVKHLQNEQNNN